MQAIKSWATSRYGHCPAMLILGCGIHETLDCLIDHSPGGHLLARKYTWYVRVADTIGFLKTISPVLERRLEGSGAHHYTGELRIGFHDLTGICLSFAEGRLKAINLISGKDGYDVSFPWLMFWNIVFGYQTCDEVLKIVPDTEVGGKAIVLLDTLFPKKRSWVNGLL
jgi:hypothetical protein